MPATPAPRRKLIEVSLPLEKINAAAQHEKSVPRRGHPATMHLWWARRPLAAARAVLFAQLVDDPSCRPEALAIENDDERARWVAAERDRLHQLIEELVLWENTTNEKLFARAHDEILRDTGGNPPPVLDPFAGGGTIPLEAQRLGLAAQGLDLNPVAALINKALVEIPPVFAGRPPVFPDAAGSRLGDWPRATGLAEDVRRYGQWIRDEAAQRVGDHYPPARLPDGSQAPVMAWIWARTVTCPNPACGIEMPLVRSWWLGKKKGRESFVLPVVSGGQVRFDIAREPERFPPIDGTVGRTGARCLGCESAVPLAHIRKEAVGGRLGQRLMAVVAEGPRSRVFVGPDATHEAAARSVSRMAGPAGEIPEQAPSFRVQAYGFQRYADLFSDRQRLCLAEISELIKDVREKVRGDAEEAGNEAGSKLHEGGQGAVAYADAVATYLAFAVSKLADWNSSLCSWIPQIQGVRDTFARQALPMVWDFTEINPFSSSVGNWSAHCTWVADGLDRLPAHGDGSGQQAAAQYLPPGALISTDPPYYDNIGYSDLSDFFYVWLRRSLRDVHPDLLGTMLTPKADELVANPYRHGGKEGARQFFEHGFEDVFTRARAGALPDFPITVYYAFKQSESEVEGESSTGWETLLGSMVRAGWAITATWPMRSERGGRMISVGTNALASSIVLALRPRPEDAPVTSQRAFLTALRAELPDALRDLQQGAIAPVDLPQAAIGPGMAVFSRYASVLADNGEPVTVREALQQINKLLDDVLWEQEGEFDGDTRFLLRWFRQYGFVTGPFGTAESMTKGLPVSIERLRRSGVLTSAGGDVRLFAPGDLPTDWDPATDPHLTVWEVALHLARVLDTAGIPAAAAVYRAVPGSLDLSLAKELTSLLFRLAEQRKDSATAQLFNALGSAWNEIAQAATGRSLPAAAQLVLDDPADDFTDHED